jgi:hypothetical protein
MTVDSSKPTINEPFIGLEIHDVSLWSPHSVLPIIETMKDWGYNALVLHQNDLLDECTQLFLGENYGLYDLRLKKVRSNTAWLNQLTRTLDTFGAKLFLEIKEPSFHDYVLEETPNLLDQQGKPDPTNPAWYSFCEAKTRDLLKRVPGLGGLIINLSSPESRVSMPDHLATNKTKPDISTWFDQMINAFHQPLSEQDKSLYVRDFSYTENMQSGIISAINRKGGTIGASIKITAHDYFPEYPENPAAGMIEAPFLFEFEAFGEHTGWGVIPNCRVGELCDRMKGYRSRGANGMLVRTSWEAIRHQNAMDRLSSINVFALPILAKAEAEPETIIVTWLKTHHRLEGEIANQAAELLLESAKIPTASYWNTKVFPRHSCLPSSWQEGWLSMETNGMGNRGHTISINPADERLSEQAGEKLFAEKEIATNLAIELAEKARTLKSHLPKHLAKQFQSFDWLPFFARQFELAIKSTFFAARGSTKDLEKIVKLKAELLSLAASMEQHLAKADDLPHDYHVLFDPDQIRLFTNSLPE